MGEVVFQSGTGPWMRNRLAVFLLLGLGCVATVGNGCAFSGGEVYQSRRLTAHSRELTAAGVASALFPDPSILAEAGALFSRDIARDLEATSANFAWILGWPAKDTTEGSEELAKDFSQLKSTFVNDCATLDDDLVAFWILLE